jgi:hypothetical protein
LANQRRLRELKRAHRSEVRVFSAHDAVELEAFGSEAVLAPTRFSESAAPL